MLPDQQTLLGMFLVFCRIGTACMLIPGFAVARVPASVRLFLALSLSTALFPIVRMNPQQGISAEQFLGALPAEILIGLLFGFVCAIFAHAVRFAAATIMSLIGLAGIPGQAIEDLEPNPPFVMFLSIAFTALVFATDLHLVSLHALLETYEVYPVGVLPPVAGVIDSIGKTLHDTSLMALQASSPFILHCLGINFALGLMGKLTPQLQAYFALLGISTLIALLILYFLNSAILSLFVGSYAQWLENGL